MTIVELNKLIDNLEKKVKTLKNNNDFLLKQQKELTKLAEKAGSEAAQWKHHAIRLENEELRLQELDRYIKNYWIEKRLKPLGLGIFIMIVATYVWTKFIV